MVRHIYVTDIMKEHIYIYIYIYIYMFLLVVKTRVLNIASLTLTVTLWGHPIRGIYRASLS